MTSVNESIYHSMVRHQIYLERYKSGLYNRLLPILEKLQEDILAQLDKINTDSSRARLEAFLKDIQDINDRASGKTLEALKKELLALAGSQSGFLQMMITQAIPTTSEIKFTLPSERVLNQIVTTDPFQGLVLKKWTEQLGDTITLKARQQLYIGLAEGESIANIRKRFQVIAEGTNRNMEAIVRTSVNHVSNQVNSNAYSSNDFFKGVQWVSTLDSRTTPICQARDGTVYPIDDHPTPPAHVNCRSVLVPVIRPFKDFGLDVDIPEGKRASMNGQVAKSENYNTWLRKQPVSFVEGVLGKGKADLYLNQNISLDKFVDHSGEAYTLKDLQEKYA